MPRIIDEVRIGIITALKPIFRLPCWFLACGVGLLMLLFGYWHFFLQGDRSTSQGETGDPYLELRVALTKTTIRVTGQVEGHLYLTNKSGQTVSLKYYRHPAEFFSLDVVELGGGIVSREKCGEKYSIKSFSGNLLDIQSGETVAIPFGPSPPFGLGPPQVGLYWLRASFQFKETSVSSDPVQIILIP
jgi:hypothetical protein